MQLNESYSHTCKVSPVVLVLVMLVIGELWKMHPCPGKWLQPPPDPGGVSRVCKQSSVSSECQPCGIYRASLDFGMLFMLFSNPRSSYTCTLSGLTHTWLTSSSFLYRFEGKCPPIHPVPWSSPAWSCLPFTWAVPYAPLILHNVQCFSSLGTRLHLQEGPEQVPC